MNLKKYFSLDWVLLSTILMLIGLSMIVLYSSSGGNVSLLIKHSIRATFALALLLTVLQIPNRKLMRWSPFVYFVGLVLLVMVLLSGIVGKGAQRWIVLGPIQFQPAEIMKLVVPMMVAWVLTRMKLPPKFGVLLLSIILLLIPTVLIILQPDLGTALLIAMAGLVVIFVAGISWKIILYAFFTVVAALPVMWAFVLHDYQRKRILTSFDPWADPLNTGYHIIQSIIAIGSGGLAGKGWLLGTQSQLDFIPERHTDFVFAVFSEEFGFIGVLFLLLIYMILIFRGLFIASSSKSCYARLLAIGITSTFFFYLFVNIGMVSGILPVVGVPLPLISYGGTSMVTLMIGFGILMRISNENKVPMRS